MGYDGGENKKGEIPIENSPRQRQMTHLALLCIKHPHFISPGQKLEVLEALEEDGKTFSGRHRLRSTDFGNIGDLAGDFEALF